MIARLPSGASLDLAALELDEVADAQPGLPREPHRVRVLLGGPTAEEVDLGVLPDDLGAVGALVEARDAVQVVDRHPLGVAPGRPAERELERVVGPRPQGSVLGRRVGRCRRSAGKVTDDQLHRNFHHRMANIRPFDLPQDQIDR